MSTRCRAGFCCLLLAASLALLVGCQPADPQVAALRKLTQSGYSLSVKEFHRAAVEGDLPALRHFLTCGTVVDVPQIEGDFTITALRQAIRHGQEAAAIFLLENGAKLYRADTDAENALLKLAVASGNTGLVRHLLHHPDCPLTPLPPLLLTAAEIGEVGIIEALLEREPDLPLEEALLIAAGLGQLAALDYLLQHGANPNARDATTGSTPLMLAAQIGDEAVVDLLLSVSADRFQLDAEGSLAADLAHRGGHKSIAARLWRLPTAIERELGTLPADLKALMPEHWQNPAMEEPPAVPVTANRSADEPRLLWPLHHATAGVHAPFITPPAPRQRLKLETVRLCQLPLFLLSIDADDAQFEDLYHPGETLAAKEGQWIGPTGFELLRIRRATPDAPLPEWLPSFAIVKQTATGTLHAFLPGVASRHGALCAVVRILPTDETYEGHPGDTFRLTNSAVPFSLKAISPRGITVTQNLATFEVPLTPSH